MNESHMAREIAEIPAVAGRFLAESGPALSEIGRAFRARRIDLVVTLARGSSDHAATFLKYAIEINAGLPVASIGPSVSSIYRRLLRLDGAACIGISQSGRSPDIVEAMVGARAGGAETVAITNFEDSPMAQAAAHRLPLGAGEEKSVAATKTFLTSALAGLAMLAEWQEDQALRNALAAMPDALSIALEQDWEPLMARLARANSVFVLGRGPALAMANEAALKLKETSGLHAESYSAAEVLHGPAAIVQAHFPVLALGVEDAALPQLSATAERLAAQGADVFVTGADVAGAVRLSSAPALHPLVDPLLIIASFYHCIEALARRRGFDPDTPPHLRKVTETV
ncbi:SIS domain-containing protein [Paracoccus sp. M683]|uniref:SIS domain-containing protein n=1 Tax=Paracoccus sp. M683 TaxID=2594268 RepID=UPI00117E5E16|nr:SIS domain-containing protein [Paracoccus sp. M683]TRW97729.1 SIS domain-containing protein [Paracoccus sp. M683]